MKALDHPRARRILELCAAEVQATVVYPDSAAPAALDAALTVLASVPALGVLARALSERRDRVSVTVPTPLGTVIVLSAHAVSTPETTLAVGAHELAHAYQIQARGGWGTAVDYLGSAELRARAEGEAEGAELAVRYVLTGELPPEAAADDLVDQPTYHLDESERVLGRGVIASHRASIATGVCPPVRAAQRVIEVLDAEGLVRHSLRWRP